LSNLIWSITGERPKLRVVRFTKHRRWFIVAVAVGFLFAAYLGVDAISRNRLILRFNPNSIAARESLVDALLRNVRLDEAIAVCREGLRLSPKDIQLRFRLAGLLRHQKKDLDGAIEVYRELTQILPGSAGLHAQMAEILVQKGDLQGALEEYRAASALYPDYKEYLDLIQKLSNQLKKNQVEFKGSVQARREKTTDGKQLYNYSIFVDGSSELLNEIKKVRYTFDHPALQNSPREETDAKNKFLTRFVAWECLGPMHMSVFMKDGTAQYVRFDMCAGISQ